MSVGVLGLSAAALRPIIGPLGDRPACGPVARTGGRMRALRSWVGLTFIFAALFVLAVDRAPPEERSHAIGSFSMAFDLAFGAGGLHMGLVADLTDRPTGFVVVAAISGVTNVVSRRILGDVSTTERVATIGPRGRR